MEEECSYCHKKATRETPIITPFRVYICEKPSCAIEFVKECCEPI
jgi:hypothetical protein